MADNTPFQATPATLPTGFAPATDDIGGVAFQRIKLVHGIDGVNDGDVANTNPLPVKEKRAATATTTSVSDTALSTTLLAANANRLGATVYNDSTVDLYLKLGATASLTSFTVKMAADGYYEVPFNYTGIIDGIWASDAIGAARIVELTA